MWDVFISHASEDKENLVRPLAQELVKYGVSVWYDEFTLELGDSLSASIDKGLLDSKYGLIVFSPAFFEKRWTDYELKSLITKELNGNKTILPIWHNVDQKFVASKSLFLADKKAIISDAGIQKLALEIIKVIRPDIINSHLLKKACRESVGGVTKNVPIENLKVIDGVRHKALPPHMVLASKLIATLFPVCSFKDTLINFAKDADYDEEFAVWIAISCSYIDAMKRFAMPFSDNLGDDKFFAYLLLLSMDNVEGCKDLDLDENTKEFLVQAYTMHLNELLPLAKNFTF